MYTQIKHVFKHSAVYSIGQFINNFIAYLLIPLYGHFLTTDEYGIIATTGVMCTVLLYLFTLSLDAAAIRFSNQHNTQIFFGTLWVFVLVNSIILTGIALWLTWTFNIFKYIDYHPFVSLSLLSVFFNAASIVPLAFYKAKEKSTSYVLYNSLLFVSNLVTIPIFLVVFNKGVEGVMWARLIASIIVFIIFTISFIPKIKICFDWHIFKQSLKFSLPLLPHSIALWGMISLNRFFLERLSGLSDAGIFSLGLALGMTLDIVIISFFSIWPPFFFRASDNKYNCEILEKIATYGITVMVVGAVGLSFFAKEIFRLLAAEQFWPGNVIVPIVALAVVLKGLYMFPSVILQYVKKTNMFIWIGGLCLIISILANYYLISWLGPIGAGWALVVTYLSLLVITQYVASRYYSFKYDYKTISRLFIISFIFFQIINSLTLDPWPQFWIKILIFVIYLFCVYLFKIVSNKEIKTVWEKILQKTV